MAEDRRARGGYVEGSGVDDKIVDQVWQGGYLLPKRIVEKHPEIIEALKKLAGDDEYAVSEADDG